MRGVFKFPRGHRNALWLLQRAQSHFQQGDYLQAQHALRKARSAKAVFLRHYATYMDMEREAGDAPDDDAKVRKRLHALAVDMTPGSDDAFGWWLYVVGGSPHVRFVAACVDRRTGGALWRRVGHVWRRLDQRRQAAQGYLRAVHARAGFGDAWWGLVAVAEEMTAAERDGLPQHWMQRLFEARVAGERLDSEAGELYLGLLREYPGCEHLMLQAALYSYNMRDFDTAQGLYEDVRRNNPYVIDGMDTYSNILYVRGLKAELSHLAHSLVEIDKYRPEACCVIGNYYSLKSQHHQAVAYFQRALKLNRRFVAAWTLVGHEYLELKNTPGAIEAYRKAIDIDPRDHRAWYGMGQAYELLQMYTYAAYYYTRACALRPHDARMWGALANTYKHLRQPHDAIQCYTRAETDPHSDPAVLLELGQLHSDNGEADVAASYYARYLARCHGDGGSGEDGQSVGACLYLARYYKERGRLGDAEALAIRVLKYSGRDKEDAKQLLHEIRTATNMQ